MKDIPVFTCQEGLATLILREIPYRGEGYILVRAVFGTLEDLLRECARFCRAAGASQVYVSGEADFTGWPVFASIRRRTVARAALTPPEDIRILPVTADSAAEWAARYNERFRAVPTAETCMPADYPILEREACFLADRAGLVGIGRIRADTLLAVATLRPGWGERLVRALAVRCETSRLTLLCAEENRRAMELYQRLGFDLGPVQRVWYRVE